MRTVYFASVRERIGRTEEVVEPPATVATVGDLMDWLSGRDEASAAAFEPRGAIRAAVDRAHARHDAPLAGAAEVAFFPPMTGG